MDEKKKEGLERPHVVDGIKEYDNPLPAWWVWIFVLTIVFGLGYMAYYHLGNGTSLDEQLAADLAPSPGINGGPGSYACWRRIEFRETRPGVVE